jgi:dienelactone hydrolase
MHRLSIIAAALFSGMACAQTLETFHSDGIWGMFPSAAISATLRKPEGAGPFPAVIVMHNCAGITDHTMEWVERLVHWGYVAMAPDSFGSRGRGSVCENVVAVSELRRVPDVTGAAKLLATLPYVKKDSIGVIGFSHGAGVVMKGVQGVMEWPSHGIKAAVAYYPFCNPDEERNIVLPLLVLIGEKDDWTPATRCQVLASGVLNPSMITLKIYPGAYHSFDRDIPGRWMKGMGEGQKVVSRYMEYNRPATRDAEARTRAFFAGLLN